MDALVAQTQQLYLADDVPWVVGYSGGKDSTAVLQIGVDGAWRASSLSSASNRFTSSAPIPSSRIRSSPHGSRIRWRYSRQARASQGLPITPHRLTPAVTDTFWVNLIGRGYPAPRPKFRWCTERLKIKPSNSFIREMVRSHGEAILVLGTRKAESSVRSHRMTDLESRRVRDLLSPNESLAQLPRLLAGRELVERRRVDLSHADRQPVGLLQQGAAHDVPGRFARWRMSVGGGLHARRAAVTVGSAAGLALWWKRTSRCRR